MTAALRLELRAGLEQHHLRRPLQRHVDARFVGFERPFPRVVPSYGRVSSTSPDAHVALQVEVAGPPVDAIRSGDRQPARRIRRSRLRAISATRPEDREFRQWYINPFELFREAFQTDALPKPDTTTLSGRRIYYSHVDGDGWRNVTQIEPYRTRHVHLGPRGAGRGRPEVARPAGLDRADRRRPRSRLVRHRREPRGRHGALLPSRTSKRRFTPTAIPSTGGYFATPAQRGRRAGVRDRASDEAGSDVVVGLARGAPRMYDKQPFSLATEDGRGRGVRQSPSSGGQARGAAAVAGRHAARSRRCWRARARSASPTSTAATRGSIASFPRRPGWRRSASASAASGRSTPRTATRTPTPICGATASSASRS